MNRNTLTAFAVALALWVVLFTAGQVVSNLLHFHPWRGTMTAVYIVLLAVTWMVTRRRAR